MPLINIKNLQKTIGALTVLDKVSIEINRNDKIALIGHNGAGKTTLIRCILGMYNYKGGIEMNGLCPRLNRTDVLKQIGFVPQTPPPIRMQLKDLLLLNNSMSSVDIIEDIHEICGRMGFDLAASINKSFIQLSGGMKQKLLIALAIVRKPLFLILDEPVANIDPQGQSQFLKEVSDLTQDTTMLICSHRLEEMLPYVNRVIEMEKGSVIWDETIAMNEGNDSIKFFSVRLSGAPGQTLSQILRRWNFSQVSDFVFEAKVHEKMSGKLTEALLKFSGIIETTEIK